MRFLRKIEEVTLFWQSA